MDIKDNSEVKRVELHCHTKMSKCDSTVSVKKLIERAKEWNMDAVAITDYKSVQAFPEAYRVCRKMPDPPKVIYGIEGCINGNNESAMNICILIRNEEGRQSLYKIMSEAEDCGEDGTFVVYDKGLLRKYRDGLLVGASARTGEIYDAITSKSYSEDYLKDISLFYDYLEICPPADESEREIIKKILELGEATHRLVVAVGDVHYLDPEDRVALDMLRNSYPEEYHQAGEDLYFRTTEEMLKEFEFLGKETAEKVVITNSRMLAGLIGDVSPVREEKCPVHIENAEKILAGECLTKLNELYSAEIPHMAMERFMKEYRTIVRHGFASLYVLAMRQVKDSNEAGYKVGIRGCAVGSFVAYLAGITDVNPLPAHYYCSRCGHYELAENIANIGPDLPEKICPECGEKLNRMGYNIPFETFAGFDGNKEPDIDLDFNPEYREQAISYLEKVFGKYRVIMAGSIGTIARDTAEEIVEKYYNERDVLPSEDKIERFVDLIWGVKTEDGIHPGGVIIVPEAEETTSFTPLKFKKLGGNRVISTEFEYHDIDHNLTKIDCLSHHSLDMLHKLKMVTGKELEFDVDNTDEILEFFTDGDPERTSGIPEYGSDYVRQMIKEAKPKSIDDLIKIIALAHGTDVWIGNGRNLIKEEIATVSDLIGTRDDIMLYLISKGIDSSDAFRIMETVRMGRPPKKREIWEKDKELMRNAGVPEWYISSCERILYLWPRSNCVSRAIISFRIALYKIHYPEEWNCQYKYSI